MGCTSNRNLRAPKRLQTQKWEPMFVELENKGTEQSESDATLSQNEKE